MAPKCGRSVKLSNHFRRCPQRTASFAFEMLFKRYPVLHNPNKCGTGSRAIITEPVLWILIHELINFHFFNCWMFSFEGWRLLLLPGRPLRRHRKKHCKLSFLIKKDTFFPLYFFKFLAIKTLDPEPGSWFTLNAGSVSVSGTDLTETTVLQKPTSQFCRLTYWSNDMYRDTYSYLYTKL